MRSPRNISNNLCFECVLCTYTADDTTSTGGATVAERSLGIPLRPPGVWRRTLSGKLPLLFIGKQQHVRARLPPGVCIFSRDVCAFEPFAQSLCPPPRHTHTPYITHSICMGYGVLLCHQHDTYTLYGAAFIKVGW